MSPICTHSVRRSLRRPSRSISISIPISVAVSVAVAAMSVRDVVDGTLHGVPEEPDVRSDGECRSDRDDSDHGECDAVLREILAAIVSTPRLRSNAHVRGSLTQLNGDVLARVLWHAPRRD